jgi:hypothetical protein
VDLKVHSQPVPSHDLARHVDSLVTPGLKSETRAGIWLSRAEQNPQVILIYLSLRITVLNQRRSFSPAHTLKNIKGRGGGKNERERQSERERGRERKREREKLLAVLPLEESSDKTQYGYKGWDGDSGIRIDYLFFPWLKMSMNEKKNLVKFTIGYSTTE